jgi:hypothetical protein
MNEISSNSKKREPLGRDELVRFALEGKAAAVQGYDAILWKIRAGYVAVLYGGLTLLLGSGGIGSLSEVARDGALSAALLFLIIGFSASAFLLDLAYKRKKIRVIVVRDQLIDFALLPPPPSDESIAKLLHISGETRVEQLLDGALEGPYREKLCWNVRLVLAPLYLVTPFLAVLTWFVARLYQ